MQYLMSLLLEMGQKAQVFMCDTTLLPELKYVEQHAMWVINMHQLRHVGLFHLVIVSSVKGCS